MEIRQVLSDKKQYLELLLLADEQEDMIDRYLDAGDMFILCDPGVVAQCVLCKLSDGVYEIKSLSVDPAHQGKGYGRQLIQFALGHYPDCRKMLVGTGDSPLTSPFYEKCGFREEYRVPNFFTANYDHPIFEAGVQLVDMVYLSRTP